MSRNFARVMLLEAVNLLNNLFVMFNIEKSETELQTA